jgi:protein O-mannosyl-transferase
LPVNPKDMAKKTKHTIRQKPVNTTATDHLPSHPSLSRNTLRLIIVIFSILLYAQTINYGFVLDDTLMITANSMTTQGISAIPDIFSNDAFVGFFGKEKDLVAGGRYRPLTHAMFAIEYELFGPSPFVGHLMNILLYALLGLIVFNTLNLCFQPIEEKKQWVKYIPFTATLLFMAHPLHTEVVANIKGRDEIISMGGSMLALFYSLRFIENRSFKYLIFSFLSLLIGLFSKENAITFMAVIPLTLYFFTTAKQKDYLLTLLPLLAASAIFILARYMALGFLAGNTIQTEILNNPFIHSFKAEEIATVIYTWLLYFKLLIFPHPLTHDYYPWHLNILNFSHPLAIISLIVTISLLITAFILFRKKHILSYGILFFAATFSIQSNLLFNIGTFMNERFMFVALLGFCLIAAYYISLLARRELRFSVIVFLLVMTLYTGKTFARSKAWKDNYTLFTTDVNVSVNSAKCNVSAAESIIEKAEKTVGDQAESQKLFHQAYTYLLHAQKLHPTYYGAYDLAGKAAFHLDIFQASYEHYRMCITINPDAPVPRNNIYLVAIAASQKNRNDEALEMLLWLTAFAPDSLKYKFELANVYEKTGNFRIAADTLFSIVNADPAYDKAWAKLGELYGKHFNDLSSSEKYLLKAFQLNPDEFSVNENLGIVYGMQNQYEQSISYFMKALSLDSTQARLHTNIGSTYGLMGRKDLAEYHFMKAKTMEKK